MASDATAMLRNAVPRSAGVRPRLLLLLVLLLSQGWTAAGKVELIQNAEDVHGLSWQELDAIFMQGTIDEGIPEGYGEGLVLVKSYGPVVQTGASLVWHGKKVEVVSGTNCPGKDCGAKGVIFNYMGAAVNWHEMPGIIYIGHFRDVKPQFKALELDDKPSVIVDYMNQAGGDEIRLVNTEKRIYLGRGADWSRDAELFAYFVLQFSDVPQRLELSNPSTTHIEARENAYQAAGGSGDPSPGFVQARPSRPSLRERPN